MIKPLFVVLILQSIYISAVAQKTASKDSILYLSQFESEDEAPAINHGDTAVSKIEKGNYVMDVKRATRFWTLHFGNPEITGQPEILEVKLKITADSLPGVYGFSWNAQSTGANTWDDYLFLLSTDKKFCIFQTKGKQNIPICPWQPNFDVYSSGYNIVRIEKRPNNQYQFYINGEMVFQQKLSPVNLMFGGLYTDAHSILYVDFVKLAMFRK